MIENFTSRSALADLISFSAWEIIQRKVSSFPNGFELDSPRKLN
jgi:hypothetical protein